jgi:rubrerythrin
MNEKVEESANYIKCCSNIEAETFRLYETLAKKVNNPESSFILGFAYDSLKNAKTLQALLESYDLTQNMGCKKNLATLTNEIQTFTKIITKISNIDYESLIEIFKELINLEDILAHVYSEFVLTPALRILADELSNLVTVDFNNFKKVFENFSQEKEKHRETIIEIIYCFEAKEAEQHKRVQPVVKYQNPDAWITQSTLHAFSKYE